MAMIKQDILVREDLGFTRGLMAAQVAHIHALPMQTFIQRGLKLNENLDLANWIDNPFMFVRGVPNPEVLEHLMKRAKEVGVPVHTWRDTVYLQVAGQDVAFENVLVGASLGPCDADKIKLVVGTMDLLQ